LRARGLRVAMPLTERPLGAQIKRAERLRARFALFVGEAELARGRFGLKNLTSGEQIEVDEAGIEAAVRDGGNDRGR
jgi:histidyl-tRNA synthetase